MRNCKAKRKFVLCREAKFTVALRHFASHRENTSRPPLGTAQTYCERKGTDTSAILCQAFSGTNQKELLLNMHGSGESDSIFP